MVDAHALGACGVNRAGSNPASPTSHCPQPRCVGVRDGADAVQVMVERLATVAVRAAKLDAE